MDNIIKGFEWYLPLAFKDCVARCKFEQGDVIYRHQPKGITWGENIRHIDFLIQVKSPTRNSSSTGGGLDVFGSNWNSEIVFEKIYPNNPDQNKTIKTTQGNFFSYLWKNDETVLTSGISMPPVLTDISAEQIDGAFIKSKIPTGWCGFAMVVDSVSDLIISKRYSINEAFASKYNFRTELYDLKEAASLKTLNKKPNSGICPTLGIELFLVQSDNLDEIQEVFKTILFKGKKDQFNINRHGQLFKK